MPTDFAANWNLEDLTLHFDGVRGKVYFATMGGEPVALKIPPPGSESNRDFEALMHFADHGGVRVLGHWNTAILMERVLPGAPLSDLVYSGEDDRATGIVCDVAARLHHAGSGTGFPPIPAWHSRYDRFKSQFPKGQYERAKALYTELAASQIKPTLLHGDLHHDNILKDDAQGWVAIDPKGYVGEPAYEFGCLLRNPGEDPAFFAIREIAQRRIDVIATKTGLDPARLLGWAYAQAVLSALWSFDDGEAPIRGLATTNTLEPLL